MKNLLVFATGMFVIVSTNAFSANADVTLTVEAIGGGTVISTPTGINCPGQCTAIFPESASITLTAAPYTGQSLVQWGGACADTEPSLVCTVQTKAGMNVITIFTEQPEY